MKDIASATLNKNYYLPNSQLFRANKVDWKPSEIGQTENN